MANSGAETADAKEALKIAGVEVSDITRIGDAMKKAMGG